MHLRKDQYPRFPEWILRGMTRVRPPQKSYQRFDETDIAMCAEISGDNKTLSTVTHFSFRSKLSHSIEPRSPLLAGLPKWAARLHKNLL